MRRKITVTIEGDLSLAQAVAEGIAMDIKPKSATKWQGSKMIEITPPLIQVVSIVKGPFLAKYTVTTKINGIEKKYEERSKSSDVFSVEKKEYLPSEFKL